MASCSFARDDAPCLKPSRVSRFTSVEVLRLLRQFKPQVGPRAQSVPPFLVGRLAFPCPILFHQAVTPDEKLPVGCGTRREGSSEVVCCDCVRMVKLASKWERLPRVRQRFRKCVPWLRLHLDVDGKTAIPCCTISFKANADIVSCMLQTTGLQKQTVGELKTQASQGAACLSLLYFNPCCGSAYSP